jgi:hypothetical protein
MSRMTFGMRLCILPVFHFSDDLSTLWRKCLSCVSLRTIRSWTSNEQCSCCPMRLTRGSRYGTDFFTAVSSLCAVSRPLNRFIWSAAVTSDSLTPGASRGRSSPNAAWTAVSYQPWAAALTCRTSVSSNSRSSRKPERSQQTCSCRSVSWCVRASRDGAAARGASGPRCGSRAPVRRLLAGSGLGARSRSPSRTGAGERSMSRGAPRPVRLAWMTSNAGKRPL